MTQNEAYQKIMTCIMSVMPAGPGLVRFKAYLSPENNYMSAAASYGHDEATLTQAPVSDVFPELFGLLVELRKTVQGDADSPWLTTDMTFSPATGAFAAKYGYERPEDGTVTIGA